MSEESLRQSKKDESYWKILSSAIELDVKKGHLKWTLSDLSRKCKITRSLIYYYFGRSKIAILNEAIKLVGDKIVGMDEGRIRLWDEGRLDESLIETRAIVSKAPYISSFINEHRDNENEIGEGIKSKEKAFFRKLKKYYPNRSNDELEGLYAFYWGLIFKPDIPDSAVRLAADFIKKRYR